MEQRRGSSAEPWQWREWIDITRPIDAQTPVWPGDAPLQIEAERYGAVTVSRLEGSCHLGTHLDAPLHLDPLAGAIGSIPLGRLLGLAEVVHRPAEGCRVGLEILEHWQPRTERVLIRTDCLPLGRPIDQRIAGIEPDLVHALADLGVLTLGIDSPSVDLLDDAELIAHYALLERSMTWIEGLWLDAVLPGLYQLLALPLALVGADAAPVRAVLAPVSEPGDEPERVGRRMA